MFWEVVLKFSLFIFATLFCKQFFNTCLAALLIHYFSPYQWKEPLAFSWLYVNVFQNCATVILPHFLQRWREIVLGFPQHYLGIITSEILHLMQDWKLHLFINSLQLNWLLMHCLYYTPWPQNSFFQRCLFQCCTIETALLGVCIILLSLICIFEQQHGAQGQFSSLASIPFCDLSSIA